jgi:hypothetical protein
MEQRRSSSGSRAGGKLAPDPVDLAAFAAAEARLDGLGRAADVDRLVAGGMSRLSAERSVSIARGTAEPGRARPHRSVRW